MKELAITQGLIDIPAGEQASQDRNRFVRRFINSALGRFARMLPPTEILDGYEDPELIETMFRKARDFSPTRRWDEFANRSAVLDFGGGFGRRFKCARPLSPDVKWAVVETPAVVAPRLGSGLGQASLLHLGRKRRPIGSARSI